MIVALLKHYYSWLTMAPCTACGCKALELEPKNLWTQVRKAEGKSETLQHFGLLSIQLTTIAAESGILILSVSVNKGNSRLW